MIDLVTGYLINPLGNGYINMHDRFKSNICPYFSYWNKNPLNELSD